ncbi:hypothetical protein L6452_22063 [Arctium lappa]|uniref:Uncharacterized protein n=1 Tax=Arctium lappa TaxID=4217 RepID=A0ACB9AZF4_ARCLA|nr:hypothetical protein L6452_22063 [Arctium lappa]
MFLDVHSHEQHPEGLTHLKTTSQALLQMAECPTTLPMAQSHGHNRTITTTYGTHHAIVTGDSALVIIAVPLSCQPTMLRYKSNDCDLRLFLGHCHTTPLRLEIPDPIQ